MLVPMMESKSIIVVFKAAPGRLAAATVSPVCVSITMQPKEPSTSVMISRQAFCMSISNLLPQRRPKRRPTAKTA